MIAVIVVPGHSEAMQGLDAKRSLALLPLGDRPVLQHIVEALVAQKINQIELIVGHAPEAVERLLGNGDRWGCRFRYHLASQPDKPYRSLKIIPELRTESWVLIHAECYPCQDLRRENLDKPILFYGPTVTFPGFRESTSPMWKGTAIFPAGISTDLFHNDSPRELSARVEAMVARLEVEVLAESLWIDASSSAALLESQTLLLERRLDGLMLNGTEREPGILISRNVVVHPTAELVAPVYIGPNSRINRGVRIGPNTVIEGECIVDSNTSIQHSLAMSGSYIGEGLELDTAIVDQNLLINVRLGTGVNINESFLLGGLKRRPRQRWLTRTSQSAAAIVLILLFLPFSLLALIFYAIVRRMPLTALRAVQIPAKEGEFTLRQYQLPCIGADAWTVQRQAGWGAFTRQFLPGLIAVASGDLGFVGLPPRSAEEIQTMSPEWKALYLAGTAGLITEAALALRDPNDEVQSYLADAYYMVRRGFSYNLKLAAKYFMRLILPA